MLERDVHKALVKRLRELGGGPKPYRRVKWQNHSGAPDLLYLLPLDGGFIEEKRPGREPDPHQAKEIKILRDAGLTVHTISCLEDIDRIFPPPTKR